MAHFVKQCPESVTTQNVTGLLPLQLTPEQRFCNAVRREEVPFRLIDQQCPLHFVCEHCAYSPWDIFERVSEHWPGAVSQRDKRGYLPRQAASLRSHNKLPLSVLFRLVRACPDTTTRLLAADTRPNYMLVKESGLLCAASTFFQTTMRGGVSASVQLTSVCDLGSCVTHVSWLVQEAVQCDSTFCFGHTRVPHTATRKTQRKKCTVLRACCCKVGTICLKK